MPRFVRPSWVEVDIEGRERFASGPRSKAGQMRIKLLVRDNGEITKSLTIECRSIGDKHAVTLFDSSGDLIYRHNTDLS